MAKKAPSAYFLFCEKERDSAKQACNEAAAGTSGKVSVASVAKELGKRWEALSAEQRQSYKDLAKQQAQEKEQASSGANAGDTVGEVGEPPAVAGFAISLVRRIMTQDPDVKRVSADAVRAVAKAAEFMIENMATRAHAVAKGNKRSTIKFADVEQVVRRDHRYVDMGLRDILAFEDTFAYARGEERPEPAAKAGSSAPAKDPKERHITAFFKA